MNIDWQNLLTLGLIAVAIAYVARRFWRLARGKQRTGCGTCPDCPASDGRKPLISIQQPPSEDYGDETTA